MNYVHNIGGDGLKSRKKFEIVELIPLPISHFELGG
jgi:hypothetical protein